MFQVIFSRAALDEVGAQWAGAEDDGRLAIGSAFQQIIQQLRTDPYGESESRGDNRRIMFVAPIGVTFEVDDASQNVNVFSLWVFRSGGATGG
jgi:hypothetical protein